MKYWQTKSEIYNTVCGLHLTYFFFSSFLCFSYTIVLIYYAFCLVLMMLLRPLLVKKIACGLGKSDRFKSIYAALYFFPILTVLQAVGGGLLCEFGLSQLFLDIPAQELQVRCKLLLFFSFRLCFSLHHTGFVLGHTGCVHVGL